MGVSTDAILVYGISFEEGEEPSFLEEHGHDLDGYFSSVSGLPQYGEPGHDFKAHWAFRAEQPAILVTHCSNDYPMYILGVRGTEITAKRGYPVEIGDLSLAIEPDKVEAFKEWCRERGIENPTPEWVLCSMWG